MVVACEDCGHRMKKRTDWKPRSADGKTRCNQCSYAYRGRRAQGRPNPLLLRGEERECRQCGQTFYAKGSEIARGNGKFCSTVCANAWMRDHQAPAFMKNPSDNSGSKNARYKDGKRVGQNRKYNPKTKVRAEVIDRDGDWCLHCARPGPGLHLHRVRYGSQGGNYEPGNCVQLCFRCHELVHSSKRLWQPQLLAHLDGTAIALRSRRPSSATLIL